MQIKKHLAEMETSPSLSSELAGIKGMEKGAKKQEATKSTDLKML